MHEEWSNKAAESGKHVLCEKSSTDSFDSAKKMVNTVKENNVRLMEGFMYRFHPSHLRVGTHLLQKKQPRNPAQETQSQRSHVRHRERDKRRFMARTSNTHRKSSSRGRGFSAKRTREVQSVQERDGN